MRLLLGLLLLVAPAHAVDPPREVGNLVFDGIPPLDPAAVARAIPYANVRSARVLAWDPAGTGLFVSTRFGETMQVHRLDGPGADRQQLTFFSEPVSDAAPDPARPGGLYVSVDRGGGEAFQIGWYTPGAAGVTWLTRERSRNMGLFVAPAGDAVLFTSNERNGTDFDLVRVDRRDASTRRRLVELSGDWTVTDASADLGRVLLSHQISATSSSLHLWEAATGTLRPIGPTGPEVSTRLGRFGPDDRSVFLTSDRGGEVRTLLQVDLATGTSAEVTPGLPWDVEELRVSPDRRWLAWAVNAGGASELWVASSARPDRPRRVGGVPLGVVDGLLFDDAGRRLAFSLSTPDTPSDVFVTDPRRPEAVTRWTRSELGGLDPAQFVAPTLVSVPSFDGRAIPAWYYAAPGPGPHPVVIQIHGGPEGQSRPSFSAPIQHLIDEVGVSVLVPNVRGSTGYGRTYTRLDNGRNRLDSVRDIGALLDWIGTRAELDASRVAVSGGSYGGYMVLASLVEYGARLRCGVDSVGISNFVTFLENTEAYRRDLRRVEYGDERDPEMRAFLEQISPRTNVGRIRSPLLVVQGLNDPRVPASESAAMVEALRGAGGEAWYLLGKDEGHGFKKRSNRETQTVVTTMFLERCLD